MSGRKNKEGPLRDGGGRVVMLRYASLCSLRGAMACRAGRVVTQRYASLCSLRGAMACRAEAAS